MSFRLTFAAVLAVSFAFAGATLAKPGELAGTIVKVSEKMITVKADLGNSTIEHDEDTTVVIDGSKATWADLKVGQQVMVTFSVSTGIAHKVQVGAAPDEDAPKKKKKKKKA